MKICPKTSFWIPTAEQKVKPEEHTFLPGTETNKELIQLQRRRASIPMMNRHRKTNFSVNFQLTVSVLENEDKRMAKDTLAKGIDFFLVTV